MNYADPYNLCEIIRKNAGNLLPPRNHSFHIRFILSHCAVPVVLTSQVFFFSGLSAYQHNEIHILHYGILSVTYFFRVRVNKDKIMVSLRPFARPSLLI